MTKEEVRGELRDDRWLPRKVYVQVEKIDKALSDYADSPKTLRSAERLISATKWPLNVIRYKLGEDSAFYIERSSSIVNRALDYMTEEVNAEHETDDEAYLSTLRSVYKLLERLCKKSVDDATSQRLSDFRRSLYAAAIRVAPLPEKIDYKEGDITRQIYRYQFWFAIIISFIILMLALLGGMLRP